MYPLRHVEGFDDDDPSLVTGPVQLHMYAVVAEKEYSRLAWVPYPHQGRVEGVSDAEFRFLVRSSACLLGASTRQKFIFL